MLTTGQAGKLNLVFIFIRIFFLCLEWEYVVPQIYGLIYVIWFTTQINKEYSRIMLTALAFQGWGEIFLAPLGRQFSLQLIGKYLLIISRICLLWESGNKNIPLSKFKLSFCICIIGYLISVMTLLRNSTVVITLGILNCWLLSLKKESNNNRTFIIGCILFVVVDMMRITDWIYLKKILLRGFGGKQVFDIFSVIGLHTYPSVTNAFRSAIELLQQIACFYLLLH